MAMRLCFECKKNHPAVSYERKVKGGVVTEHYCLACYETKFLSVGSDGHENGRTYETCPYCGTTAETVKKTALVGCAHCYHTLGVVAIPMTVRMQQGQADVHRGKRSESYSTRQRQEIRRKELIALVGYYESLGDSARAEKCKKEALELERRLRVGQ
jgi:protein-arginine kinase activator protein McsA